MEAYLKFNKEKGSGGVVVRLDERSARNRVLVLLERKKLKEAFELFRDEAQVLSYVPPETPLPSGAWISLNEDHL